MFSTLLAHTDGWGYGPGPWFLIFPFLWFGLIAFVLWRFRRGAWGAWRGHQSGRSVLAERYARGEISADEYRERRAVLDEVDR
ncbi:MAG TPA: SHOCT domain-containing protein [Acidimicrobiales bacterium]|jgi:putative membrane protein